MEYFVSSQAAPEVFDEEKRVFAGYASEGCLVAVIVIGAHLGQKVLLLSRRFVGLHGTQRDSTGCSMTTGVYVETFVFMMQSVFMLPGQL